MQLLYKFLFALILLTIVSSLSPRQRPRKNQRKRRGLSKSSGESVTELGPGECEICSKENKIRPETLTLEYVGGQGKISKYQDEDKATCRDQIFPLVTVVTAYGVDYPVAPGTFFTIDADANGGRLDAETDFDFADGTESCYIHTSCSQPLVAGDQIGPFIIREGNECKACVCEANASYENGMVTIDFAYCDVEAQRFDWIGIYPCDAETFEADSAWDESVFYENVFEVGYTEGETYVDEDPVWFAYTCGSPGDKCQQNIGMEWPSSGEVYVDSAQYETARWAFPGSTTLEPGCYKTVMNRETIISGPPYPTICKTWAESNEFIVS